MCEFGSAGVLDWRQGLSNSTYGRVLLDGLVWDFGGFSCLAGEVAAASEADRAPSDKIYDP